MTTEQGLKVIVEGLTDAKILRAILGEALSKKVQIFAGQGRASLATVGRNILFHEGGPVLLVRDSETLDPNLNWASTDLWERRGVIPGATRPN